MMKRQHLDLDKLYDHIIDTMVENMDYESASMDEEYDIDDTYMLVIDISAKLDCKFARDDDYFNGTGVFYTTSAETRVNRLEIDLFNKETDEYEDLHGLIDFSFLRYKIEEQLTEAAYE